MGNVLYVGNRNYSSWSLRPWLCLKWAGIAFEERLVRLDQPGYGDHAVAEIAAASPNGRVPCLHADGLVIWDSLAIAEWAAEEAPSAGLWPIDRQVRATARAVTSEIHGGFWEVREHLPMNIRRRAGPQAWGRRTAAEIARIDEMWSGLRADYGGGGRWLFGARTIADAFYTPVAARMRTYGVALSPTAQSYCDAVLSDTEFLAWEADCLPDSWDRHGYSVIDGLYR